MPSAANVKIDKQISPENALADSSGNSLTPLRQAITTIEHKIRNLEKRKSKLESYKELQNAGKELNADQKTAVAKFNEVAQTLEFARDLYKQFLGIASVSEKEAKKLAKKEAAAKNQAELARLREILLVQDALNQMGNENVRDDFLQGRNGAAQLTESDLKLLDDLYPAVTPKHEAGNPTAFTNEVQTAAEHLLAVVDGKSKEIFGGSYSQIKEILGKIHESGYFDQSQVFEGFVEGPGASVEQESLPIEHVPILNHEMLPQEQQVQLPSTMPPGTIMDNLPLEVRPSNMHQPQQAVIETQQPPLEQQPIPPEQVYYQPQPAPLQQQQPPQPLRPITEMLGSGSFFFLQESEIDPPTEQQPIPSQTFTNQSFVATGPPPPIPLPPHFQQMPGSLPPNLPAAVATSGNGIIDDSQQQQPPQQQQQPPQQQPQILKQQQQAPSEEIHKSIAPGVNHQRAPPASVNQRVNNNNHQSFYQNNNGYSNNHRPRQQQPPQRNGPRPGNNSNRHN